MNQNILIVDDEIGIRLLLEDLLESEGFSILTAKNGQEALDIISKNAIDLMIIDYKLPKVDGIEVLMQLAHENKQIDTIVMSGLVENIQEEITELANVKKILSKPFDVLEVRDYVKQHLAN
ncbi:response regulator [Ornithinibacillus halotolerans]|uniref:Response regulator n=1 Tax=Ornithinibacillus halotolerans TaxID=1274357 RepID=A0A916RRA2_9BACI|nr:response regulator [Ornithinibacillus halotolerans]GGA64108.1 response regulator [Ornithinibacillus halotolerans]